MKKYRNQKKAILIALLASLTTASLTGCGKTQINGTDIKLEWKNDDAFGTVPYDDIKENIKVVILEQNGTIEPFLMIRELSKATYRAQYTELSYINLKNGETMMEYRWESTNATVVDTDDPDYIYVGKYIKILEEKDFYDYLYEYGEIKDKFDVNEIIDIYNNKEPELIKYIEEKYNYTKKLQ